jgi:hypothetical protein
MKIIRFPNDPDFFSNLILQRTGPFIKLGGEPILDSWFSHGEKNSLFEFLSRNKLLDVYIKMIMADLHLELTELTKNIPESNFERVISVGPGNGLVELLILKLGLTSELLLIDIEKTKEHYHGFNRRGSGYADLNTTKMFLELNIDYPVRIHICNPLKDEIPNFKFSLFTSLLSMGFHYPCDEYADYITRNAEANSMIIFDKRLSSHDPGFEKLSQCFTNCISIRSGKSERVFLSSKST